jgi:hypothetical protein
MVFAANGVHSLARSLHRSCIRDYQSREGASQILKSIGRDRPVPSPPADSRMQGLLTCGPQWRPTRTTTTRQAAGAGVPRVKDMGGANVRQ